MSGACGEWRGVERLSAFLLWSLGFRQAPCPSLRGRTFPAFLSLLSGKQPYLLLSAQAGFLPRSLWKSNSASHQCRILDLKGFLPSPLHDLVSVQGEDIRFSTHLTPPGQMRFSWSLGGTGGVTVSCPSPRNRWLAFCHSDSCPHVEVSLVPPRTAAGYYFISEEGPGHGWYFCSTLEPLQVLHVPTLPRGSLRSLAYPLSFSWAKSCSGRAGSPCV